MTDESVNNEGLALPLQTAGGQLRSAREAAGMSLDQVAQQLKLAPRQVKALEEEAFDDLPGRTFTRGFVRNYARLLGLDAAALIALLPDAAHAPSLESPALQSTLARMGELPSAQRRPASFSRWLIPLVLIACVVAAAAYEWYRSKPANMAPTTGVETEAPPAASAVTTVPLPNPVADKPLSENKPAADVGAPATAPASSAQPVVPVPAPTAPALSSPAPAPNSTTAAPHAGNDAKPNAVDAPHPAANLPTGTSVGANTDRAADTIGSASNEPSTDAPLVINTTSRSWTEIRDRHGRVLISRTVPASSSESIDGAPPFSVVLGNADAVTLVYRGAPVDLAPHTRGNVARLVLK